MLEILDFLTFNFTHLLTSKSVFLNYSIFIFLLMSYIFYFNFINKLIFSVQLLYIFTFFFILSVN